MILRTEFHCHTLFSKDCLTTPKRLIATCHRKNIQRVIITDHNTIVGAIQAKEIDPNLVIVGVEIKTTEGELLAAYVKEHIPPGLPPKETISRLREQDAFISVSHPFDRWRPHWKLAELLKIIPLVDAIEVYNSRNMYPWANREAKEFLLKNGLLGTVGSDAHTSFELGKATMHLSAFHDSASLIKVLPEAETAKLSVSPFWIHFFSRYAVWKKTR